MVTLYMLFGLVRFLESAGFPLTFVHVGAVSSFITTTLLYWGGWQGQQVAHSGSRVCAAVSIVAHQGGSTPLLFLVRVLGTSWDHHHHHATQSSHSINAIGPAPLWSGRKREHCSIMFATITHIPSLHKISASCGVGCSHQVRGDRYKPVLTSNHGRHPARVTLPDPQGLRQSVCTVALLRWTGCAAAAAAQERMFAACVTYEGESLCTSYNTLQFLPPDSSRCHVWRRAWCLGNNSP
jgi:hypothetical protein